MPSTVAPKTSVRCSFLITGQSNENSDDHRISDIVIIVFFIADSLWTEMAEALVDELWLEIFSNLSSKDLVALSRVCHAFNLVWPAQFHFILNKNNILWNSTRIYCIWGSLKRNLHKTILDFLVLSSTARSLDSPNRDSLEQYSMLTFSSNFSACICGLCQFRSLFLLIEVVVAIADKTIFRFNIVTVLPYFALIVDERRYLMVPLCSTGERDQVQVAEHELAGALQDQLQTAA